MECPSFPSPMRTWVQRACLEGLHNAEAMPFGRYPVGWDRWQEGICGRRSCSRRQNRWRTACADTKPYHPPHQFRDFANVLALHFRPSSPILQRSSNRPARDLEDLPLSHQVVRLPRCSSLSALHVCLTPPKTPAESFIFLV